MRAIFTLALAAATALPALADDLPPGIVSARLIPGHAAADGTRVTALDLQLEPGWKTYWRSPGDSGVPPQFDWSGAANVAGATPLWPTPEVIDSGGDRTLGYHDRLVLPIELAPHRPGQPMTGPVAVDLGVCENVCVPVHVTLDLPAPDAPGTPADPLIAAALARMPDRGDAALDCTLADIADGVQVTAGLAAPAHPDAVAAAMELAEPGVWVSQADLTREGGRLTATADFVGPTGKPFALDPAKVRLTLIGPDGAVEYQGCAG
ncbi:protein-disulfide reductase DsbD domain-containing protein [Paracoccus luteus]|uniref:protein-disulfide reductase DsbD domain-containing protein n=1 Tax=Paracoccus luteus TaxID=2508543 RepID=UPI001FE65902|nr:protein-disulfide reductase DsbD domain-containing protein [Paracoccus luteus]